MPTRDLGPLIKKAGSREETKKKGTPADAAWIVGEAGVIARGSSWIHRYLEQILKSMTTLPLSCRLRTFRITDLWL